MSFKSILSDVGTFLKKVFDGAAKVAAAAEPIIDLAFPGISTLYNATVTEIITAENAAIAAGQQNGTGAQKLAMVVAAVTPSFNAYAAANGLPIPTLTTIEAYVNATVAGLNAIPTVVPTPISGTTIG